MLEDWLAGASSRWCKVTQEVLKGKIWDILQWTKSVTWSNTFNPAEDEVDDGATDESGAGSDGGLPVFIP